MTEKFLICIDLDGTLLRDDKTISEETKKLWWNKKQKNRRK